MRIQVGELREIDLFDVAPRPLLSLLRRATFALQHGEHHVLEHGLPRQELIELLEDHHAVWPRAVHDPAVEGDRALDGFQEACHTLEQGGLAASRRPQQHEPVSRIDLKADAVCGCNEVVLRLVLKCDALDVEDGLDGKTSACRWLPADEILHLSCPPYRGSLRSSSPSRIRACSLSSRYVP